MNNGSPKVSIIMPSLNTVDYIDEALRSATRQTLRDIEIICVDAGSTDGTYDIIQKYAQKDSRIKVYISDIKSYGFQMNLGLDAAKGEFIGIIEPDDYVSLDMFEDLYAIATKNELDFVKADFYRFTTDPETEDMTLVYNHLSENDADYGVVFCPNDKLDSYYFIMNTWSGIYRRSFIEKHGIRHNETPGASYQDNGFYFQTFAHAERVMLVKHPYYMNRRDNPNSSMSDPGKVDAVRVEYDFIRDRLQEEPELWEKLKTVHSVKRFDNYCATARRIAPNLVQDYLNWASSDLQGHIDAGELDLSQVPESRANGIKLLVNNPGWFYYQSFADANAILRAEAAEQRIKDLEGSLSFRVGRIITALPRTIRDLAKGNVGSN